MTTITVPRELLEQALEVIVANTVGAEDIEDALRAALSAPATAPDDDCAPYLKDNETPAERIKREIRDTDAALTLLIREKKRTKELEDLFLSACIDGDMNGDSMKKAMAEYVKQPAWHDAPTVPGIWICDEGDICYTWTAHNIEILDQFDPGDGLRWFGPILEDKQ